MIRDHPRSRGVYSMPMRKFSVRDGSSPLARGLPYPTLLFQIAAGIIPARAGFTVVGVDNLAGIADHPRSRGVYVAPEGTYRQYGGSSPLARGLPRRSVILH